MARENPAFCFSEGELAEPEETQPELALEVHDAWLTYGKGENAYGLKGADLNVPRGTIYALLGPSGCGKTTLLCSAVGIKFLDRGSIRIFGERPGSKESGVPGSWAGYMPQELAMYLELTAEETLSYFGSVHCMARTLIQKRSDLLLDLLEIPRCRRVRFLSGGQQRRLSLAVALIHDPPLLLLDEPTVGVDPLLRRAIWKHLIKLTAGQGKTVVITTHYVEEARAAHRVGLMRDGRVLVEDNPETLMSKYEVASLEQVFLRVCISEEQLKARDDIAASSKKQRKQSESNSIKETVFRDFHEDGCSGEFAVKKTIEAEADVHSNESESWTTANDDEFNGDLTGDEDNRGTNEEAIHVSDRATHVGDTAEVVRDNLNMNLVTTTTGDFRRDVTDEMEMEDSSIFIKLPTDENEIDTASENPSVSGVLELKEMSTLTKKSEVFRQRKMSRDLLPKVNKSSFDNLKIIYAITLKNTILMRRTIALVIIAFVTPTSNTFLTRTLWGHTPFDLPLVVVNNELNSFGSQSIIQNLDHHILNLRYRSTFEEGLALVKAGEAIGVLEIPQGFILNVIRRFRMGLAVNNETLLGSRLRIHMDKTNIVNAIHVYISILRSTEKMGRDVEHTLGTEPGSVLLPLVFEKPILGKPDPEMADVYTTGLLSDHFFLMSLVCATLIFMSERTNGMFDRNRVSGITPIQLVVSHFLIQSVMTLLQYALVLALFAIIQMEVKGSWLLLMLMCYLSSYLAMSIGILISAVTQNTAAALTIAFGVTIMSSMTTGSVWPIESVPHWSRYLCMCHPNTWTIQAVKLIISHGLGLTYYQIWTSVLLNLAWTALILTLAVFGLTKNSSDRIKIKIII